MRSPTWIKKARMSVGLTQAGVAEKAGVIQQAYGLIENERVRPRIETAQKLATILNVNWTDFYEKKNEAP